LLKENGMKPARGRKHFAGLTGAIVVTLVTLAMQRQSAQSPPPSTEPPPSRLALTSMPASPALRQAVNRFRQSDPSASFTWLRGHVDAFIARPKPSVPDYARPILQQHGLSTDGVTLIKETTTSLPNDSRNDSSEPVQELPGTNIGFDGPSDPAPKRDTTPVEDATSKMARRATGATSGRTTG
jgi:hypothetical protein